MKLHRYLFQRFIPVFLGSLGFFSPVLILVDLLMNLTSYIQNNAAASDVARVILLYLPKTIWYAMPLGILFAVAYTLSDLYANNELTAIFSSGVSLIHFVYPLLIFSIIMSFVLFFFENFIVVPTLAEKNELQNSLLHKEKSLNKSNIVVISDGGLIVYKARHYESASKRLSNLYIIFRDDEKKLKAIVYSDYALWDETSSLWNLGNSLEYDYENEIMTVSHSVKDEYRKRLSEGYEVFQSNVKNIQDVDAKQAKGIYLWWESLHLLQISTWERASHLKNWIK